MYTIHILVSAPPTEAMQHPPQPTGLLEAALERLRVTVVEVVVLTIQSMMVEAYHH